MCEPEEEGKKLSKRPLSSALHWVLVASVLELIQRPQNYAKTVWRTWARTVATAASLSSGKETLPASSQDGHVCEAHSTTRNPVTPEAALGRQGSGNPWGKESDQRAATCQL